MTIIFVATTVIISVEILYPLHLCLDKFHPCRARGTGCGYRNFCGGFGITRGGHTCIAEQSNDTEAHHRLDRLHPLPPVSAARGTIPRCRDLAILLDGTSTSTDTRLKSDLVEKIRRLVPC